MNLFNYLIALFLTVIIEALVALFFGYNNKKILISTVYINLITHSLFCYFLWINSVITLITIDLISIILIEIFITISESALLYFVLKQKYLSTLRLSFYMNIASFLFGVLIFDYNFINF